MTEERLKTLSLEKERVLRIPKEISCQNRYSSVLEGKVFEERGNLRKQVGERNFFQKVGSMSIVGVELK